MATNFEAAVGRFKRDKVVIAMLLAGGLILGVGTFLTQDDPKKPAQAPVPAVRPMAAVPNQPVAVPAAPQPAPLQPKLATDFVAWWLQSAMDYRAASAKASHLKAFEWMTPDASRTFQYNYWTPEIEAGITTGQVSAAFQPVSVQAQAINPDGSIVVSAMGTLMVQQANGTPMSQQFMTDFLVKRDAGSLRIAGLYNRQVATASATQ